MRPQFVIYTLVFTGIATAMPVRPTPQNNTLNSVIPPVGRPVNTRARNETLVSRLMTTPSHVQRQKLLDRASDYVFDFNANSTTSGPKAKGKGGFSSTANSQTMPALIGNGESMTVAFLGPCGMNSPHVHNRATELLVAVKGRLVTNFMSENGATPMQNTLSQYQMAVFPQGAIHQEFNPDCEDAAFVAAFSNEDPGVSQVANNLFSLRPDVMTAALGGALQGKDIESFRAAIPANVALGIDACLDRCGIKRNAKRSLEDLLGAKG